MSATLSGVFELVDRASPALEKIEKRAKSADRALEKLGRRMDRLGNGSATRSMERLDKSMDKAARSAERLSRRMDRLGRQRTRINVNTREVNQAQREIGKLQAQMAALSAQSALTGGGTDHLSKKVAGLENELAGARKGMQSMGREAETLTMKLAKFGAAFYGVTKIVQIIKIPAMIAGVGLLVKWVGALAGGVAALLPKLTDLVGIAGAAPAAFMGMATAMGAVKLSFSGMGEALQGNADAFKKLTPEAQKFVGTLKSMKPIVGELRRASQQGLFPGLEVALQKLKRGVPTIKEMLKATGATVGRGASRFAAGMTTEKALGDMSALNKISNRGLSRMFDTITSLARAFVSLGVAAGPFVDWMSKSIKLWAKHLQLATDNARATGRLGDFFDRTKHSMQTFGSILKNLWQTFRGIGRASRELGDDLWSSADRATKSWATWANSVQGQSWLRNYFDSIKETLHETFGLVGDLFRAFMRLSSDRSMAGLVHKLREMVPLLEKALGDTSRLLGGPMLDALAGVMRIFTNGAWLEQFMRLLANVTNLLGFMMEKIPGITAIITAITAVKVFGPVIGAVRTLAASWGLVAESATAAAAAQGAASGMGAAGALGARTAGSPLIVGGSAATAGRMGMWGRFKEARNTPVMPSGALPRSAAGAKFAAESGKMMSIPAAAKASTLGMGTMAAGGLRAAGKVARPIAALFAASDFIGTKGTIGERTQGALSGATFGLFKAPELGAESKAKGAANAQAFFDKRAGKSFKSVAGDTRHQISRLEVLKTMADMTGDDDKKERISAEIKILREKLPGIIKSATVDRNRRSRENGKDLYQDLQTAYSTYRKKMSPTEAFEATQKQARRRIGNIPNAEGKKVAQEGFMRWGEDLAKKEPQLKKPLAKFVKDVKKSYSDVNKHVKVVNGQIYKGTKSEWDKIAKNLKTPVQEAKQSVMDDFTAIQKQAVNSLMAMGMNRGEANKLVAGSDATGSAPDRPSTGSTPSLNPTTDSGGTFDTKFNARGGRIRGRGLHDTVPVAPNVMAAPGELIVNRHTENRIDRALRPMGTSLGMEVGREGRPHSAPPAGGIFRLKKRENAMTGARVNSTTQLGSGFSGGDIVALGRYLQSQGFAVGENPAFGGVAPVHSANSYHYSGKALDINADSMPGGEKANLDRLNSWLSSNRSSLGIVELLWQVADHFDHLHLAMGGAGAATGGIGGAVGGAVAGVAQQIAALKAPKSKQGGVAGALANARNSAYAKGVTALVNKRLQASGGVGGGGGGGTMTFDQVARLAESVGLPGVTFAQIAQGESSLNPTVVGHDPGGTQGLGLWQITTGFNDDIIKQFGGREAMFNPSINARAAKAIYDRQGIGAWYGTKYMTGTNLHYQGAETGGRVGWGGWHGNGGDFSVSKPTLLGVGERGKEHISIKPAGKGGGKGGGNITVHIANIENHRKGDIKKMIEEEMGMLANELTFVGADHD